MGGASFSFALRCLDIFAGACLGETPSLFAGWGRSPVLSFFLHAKTRSSLWWCRHLHSASALLICLTQPKSQTQCSEFPIGARILLFLKREAKSKPKQCSNVDPGFINSGKPPFTKLGLIHPRLPLPWSKACKHTKRRPRCRQSEGIPRTPSFEGLGQPKPLLGWRADKYPKYLAQ